MTVYLDTLTLNVHTQELGDASHVSHIVHGFPAHHPALGRATGDTADAAVGQFCGIVPGHATASEIILDPVIQGEGRQSLILGPGEGGKKQDSDDGVHEKGHKDN
jgi:hypothetical protein